MKKNNKQASVTTVLLILIIILLLIILSTWYFLPKGFFDKSSSSFGHFKSRDKPTNYIPQSLKWKKSFSYGKKDEDENKGSYMRYMIEQNKNKK